MCGLLEFRPGYGQSPLDWIVTMPSLARKPDSSCFRKIALEAVGSRHVAPDLLRLGHRIVELERGAMDSMLWKGVNRKRVRC